MGGEMALISSVVGLMAGMQQPSGPADNSAQQAQKTADERRRKRGKVTEARQLEKKRMASTPKRQTTLANGGAGLINDPEVTTTGLKNKLGE